MGSQPMKERKILPRMKISLACIHTRDGRFCSIEGQHGIELLKHTRHLGKSEEEDMPEFYGQPFPWPFALKIVQPALVPSGMWVPGQKQQLNYML